MLAGNTHLGAHAKHTHAHTQINAYLTRCLASIYFTGSSPIFRHWFERLFKPRCQRAEREHLCLLPQTSALVSSVRPSTCCHRERDSPDQISAQTGSAASLWSCRPLVVVIGKCNPLTQCRERGILFDLRCIFVILYVQKCFSAFPFPCFVSPAQLWFERFPYFHTVCYFLWVLMLFILIFNKKKKSGGQVLVSLHRAVHRVVISDKLLVLFTSTLTQHK